MSDARANLKKVNNELVKWQTLSSILENEDLDVETLVDTLDGETELVEALQVVGSTILEDQMTLAGIDEMLKKLSTRKDRYSKAIETKRTVILQAMDSSGLPSVKTDLFTLSARKTQRQLLVTDEMDVPSRFFIKQDPKLDTKALKKALTDGEEIKGAELSEQGLSLNMRIQ